MPRWSGLILAGCAAALAQTTPDNDPVEVLMRLRDQVLRHGERIPNHTCVETIVRDRFEPVTGRMSKSCDALLARRKQTDFPHLLRLDTTDRLRLDVGMASDSEMYSWAGARRFEAGELDEWLPEGAIGTGGFASLLLSVFQSRSPKFVFEDDVTEKGRALLEYSYRIAQEDSQYRVKAGHDWAITGYTGTLLVDARSAELVRFTVRTEELPASTTLCETDSTLEYGTVRFSGVGYLLAVAARQRYIMRNGVEAENRATFDHCREFESESKVEFGKAPRAVPPAPGDPAPLRLPAGLPLSIEVTAPIDCGSAAAGDRIEGRLIKEVRDPKEHTVLLPEGARLEGRLMRVETRYSKSPEVVIALRWEMVEAGGTPSPVWLAPSRRLNTLKTIAEGAVRTRGIEIELPPPNEGRYGIYRFPGEQPVVPGGFRTEWLTIEP